MKPRRLNVSDADAPRRPVERTAPMAMLLYGLVVVWFGHVGHRLYRPLEALHIVGYFAEETTQAYLDIGLTDFGMGYFASRSAAMGPVRPEVTIPVVASGGAGSAEHFPPAVDAGADAVLAASIFHFGEVTIGAVKDALAASGHPVRRAAAGVRGSGS